MLSGIYVYISKIIAESRKTPFYFRGTGHRSKHNTAISTLIIGIVYLNK